MNLDDFKAEMDSKLDTVTEKLDQAETVESDKKEAGEENNYDRLMEIRKSVVGFERELDEADAEDYKDDENNLEYIDGELDLLEAELDKMLGNDELEYNEEVDVVDSEAEEN